MSIRFLADANFNGAVVCGLLRRMPSVDIVRFKTWAFPARKIQSFWIGPLGRGASS
jgi:hypothetical protein